MNREGDSCISPRLDLDVGEVVNNVPNESANVHVSVEDLQRGIGPGALAGSDSLHYDPNTEQPDGPGLSYQSIPSAEKPIDIVFMFVHGASFSSKLFDSNLKEFLGSLSDVNHDWFWELNLNFHVEMIDWKSCLAPYQFKSISRCMPVESIYETEDDETENASSTPDSASRCPEYDDGYKSIVSEVSMSPEILDPSDRPEHVRQESLLQSLSKYFRWHSADDSESRSLSGDAGKVREPKPASEPASAAEPLSIVVEDHTEPLTESISKSRRRSSRGRRGSHASNIPLQPSNVQEFYELQKKHGLRVYFSNTVVDVMFYLTARFGGFMSTQVGRMLNERVRDLKESPCGRFRNSEIVLVGHSLGSVILYELLAQRPLRATAYDDVDNDETSLFADQSLPSKEDSSGAILNFSVKHLFLWGSPLSSFLVLKNDKSLRPDGPLTQNRGKDFRMYNIYHRSDPIATRIEPIFYRDRDYIPPAVRIPSYHHGDVLRRGLELVAKNSVRAAATMFVNKLFSNGNGAPIGTEEWVKKLIDQRRYTLPDTLNRFQRFGILSLAEAEKTRSRPRLNISRNQEASTEGISEQVQFAGLAEGKEDRGIGVDDVRGSLESGKDDEILRQPDSCGGHKPWTIRQLALNCSRKLRKKASLKIQERLELIQVERRRGVLIKLFSAIDLEFDSLLNSICSIGISKIDSLKYEEENWMDEKKLSECLRQWQSAALGRELLLTSNQLRQEIVKSLSCRGSEIEREGQNHYPLRLDFCLAGGIQEMLIAPLGLLQSHLKYWGDRDTCLFMLKMITGFSPQIARSRREIIVSEAQRTKERVMRLIQKIAK